jgi:hypothetical protein
MREIRSSGLMRAGAAEKSAPPLLDFEDATQTMHPRLAKTGGSSSDVIRVGLELRRIMGLGQRSLTVS